MSNIDKSSPENRDLSLELKTRHRVLRTAAQNKLLSFCQLIDPHYEAVWFHEVIANILEDALARTLEKKKTRIIIAIPPRHGKTQTASIYFPAWALGKYPNLKFILSSYGADLSTKVGMKTRDVINNEQYQAIFPKTQLRPDSKSKAYWLTKQNGSYFATGIGGPVTGEGGNCFTGETTILTEKGHMRIDALVSLQDKPMVLSYNHGTNECEWKRILATAEREVGKVIRVTTNKGSSLVCTPEHRIFTENGGYIGAKALTSRDILYKIKDMSCVFNKANQKKNLMQRVLGCFSAGTRDSELSLVREKCSEEEVRSRKVFYTVGKQRHVLRGSVCAEASLVQEQTQVYSMPKTMRKKDKTILLNSVQEENESPQGSSRYTLQTMWNRIFHKQHEKSILLTTMQKSSSFKKNDRRRKLSFQNWGELQLYLSKFASYCLRKRQEYMCSMQENKKENGSTSCGSQPQKQCAEKPDTSLCYTSCNSSQVEKDSISLVQGLRRGSYKVYDIQVEDNHNFFANGVLVHNCIIIDDPHKNREEAESQTYRDTVWEYYRSTLYSRLEGAGTVIVIMQRWHCDDLIGRLLEADEESRLAGQPTEDWEVINFPAIAETDEFYKGHKTRSQGQPLWPSKFPINVLENIREVQGTYNWSSQYMADPILAENQEFKKEMFRYYDEEDLKGHYLKYMSFIDPAISQKKDADNTVVLTIAKEINGPNFYRVREDAGKFTPQQTVDLIFKHYELYHSEVHLESVAYQKALKFAIEEQQKVRQRYFRVYETKIGNKEIRIRGLLPLYERGVVFHRRSDVEYERELLQFPRGKHDDRVDCQSFLIEAMANGASFGKAKQYYPHLLNKLKKK